jgi:hypothetical protein
MYFIDKMGFIHNLYKDNIVGGTLSEIKGNIMKTGNKLLRSFPPVIVCSVCLFLFQPSSMAEQKEDQYDKAIPDNNNPPIKNMQQYKYITVPHEILKDLPGARVAIEDFSTEAKKYGFTTQTYHIVVESRLRQHDIKVLTERQQLKTPGSPYLYVNIYPAISEELGLAAVSINVQLRESVQLLRNPAIAVTAATWETGHETLTGLDQLDNIKDAVSDCIDEFIHDYLVANPRPLSSETSKKGVVRGISYSEEGNSVAIIGENIVREGDNIDEIKIIRIYKDHVEFEKNSMRWTQSLNDPPGPQWQ